MERAVNLADVFMMIVGNEIDMEFVAYDGSKAGRTGSDVRLEVKSARAVDAMVGAPGQLGIARAYVNGDVDFTGDVYTGFERLASAANGHSLGWSDKAKLIREFAPKVLGRLPAPPEEVRLSGRRHGRSRDAAAISHHYDVSNAFYRLLLGPTMAYTCAVFPTADASLEAAQEEKFDLVCRKLGLRPGMRLLDVGCGWGGMVRHAALNYQVRAIGVTLSRRQAEWGARMVEEEGLSGIAEVRHGDYRDVPESSFDAVSSIGLTEHIGKDNYPAYFRMLRAKMVDGGRLLNHCITRSDTGEATFKQRGFINRYIFPDGELVNVGHLIDRMERDRLEVQHEENLRIHYAMTLAKWSANLDENWDEAVAEVGLRKARIWRLYLAGSRWGFVHGTIQLHQVLATRTSSSGGSGMPLRPDW